jgi:hypothetical protein
MKYVKCQICGENKKVPNKYSAFVCCSTKQKITTQNWLNQPLQSPKASERSNKKESKEAQQPENSIREPANPSENASSSEQIVIRGEGKLPAPNTHNDDLEIEEEEHDNPLESFSEPLKTPNSLTPCPECNFLLKDYETPCPNCDTIIEWGED